MTTGQIQNTLHKSGKDVGLTQLYSYLNKLKISPLGARQRPQQYPDDSAARILKHLGFSTFAEHNGITALATLANPTRSLPTMPDSKRNGHASKILSMKQIKKQKAKR